MAMVELSHSKIGSCFGSTEKQRELQLMAFSWGVIVEAIDVLVCGKQGTQPT